MTFELKTLSPDAVPAALEKARLYRYLNEPGEAESICRDVLDVDPHNQDALIMLLLALTGYGFPSDRQHSTEAGFDHHLVKPVDPRVLMSLIDRERTLT